MQSHEKAFRNLMQSLSAMNLDFCSDVYVYDQMNYVLPETKDAFVAKYAVRVNNPD